MKAKDNNIEGNFVEEAVDAIPEAKQMLVESVGLHTVLALSLADIYGGEAKRLKAKHGADDPRVAEAKLRKGIATEHAKEIVEALVSKKALTPPATQEKKGDETVTKPAAASEVKKTAPSVVSKPKAAPEAKASTKAATRSKAVPKKKAKPKIKSKPPTARDAKPAVKKAPTHKVRPKK